MSKLKVEKITKSNSLTLKEQEALLEDLFMCEALIVAYETYCKSIGKYKEAKEFVRQFMNDITNEKMEKNI